MAGPSFKINALIHGEDAVQAMFLTRESKVRVELKKTLMALGEQVAQRARAGAPSRSGKLQRSIKAKFYEGADKLAEYVKPRAYYGQIVESGVNANVSVKGYTRKVKSRDVRGMKLSAKTGKMRKAIIAKGFAAVKAYERSVHIEARKFMEPAWASIEGRVQSEIAAAVQRGIAL
jgi:hypothetical protein